MEQKYLAILDVLKKSGAPVSIKEIQNQLEFDIEPRTLRRRLTELEKSNFIKKTGNTRGTFYQINTNQPEGNENNSASAIPLSREAGDLLKLVNQPIQKRKPVGYNSSFLELYRPNVDSYLTKVKNEIWLR